MSPQDLLNPNKPAGVAVSKPKSDVYTMMLFLAFVAICLAITLLCLEMAAYDWDIEAKGAQLRSQPQSRAADPPSPLNSFRWRSLASLDRPFDETWRRGSSDCC